MGTYYDGTKLLSMKDLNGETPEIFICTANRTAGKTTYFGRLLINRFKKEGRRFGLLYRWDYELDDVADKFFKDIASLFFPGDVMTSKRYGKVFSYLILNGAVCGYAFALNKADQIKKLSHLFSDVDSILFDEFQSETNHYCPNEVAKFQSIHTSIARGQNKQVRYVPVYMVSNLVSIINPYYVEMNLSSRLTDSTKFLRGNGVVLEQGYNESASQAQRESGFNKAFGDSDYLAYSAENVYLNDNKAFIAPPAKSASQYLGTIRYMGVNYGIRAYRELGIIYCDNKADNTFPLRVSVTTEDHDINYVMLRQNSMFISSLRFYFENGAFRFKDLKCKEAILKCISY